MDAVKLYSSIIIGAAAGAVVGYLLAPDSNDPGKVISKKADKFADQMQRLINEYNSDIRRTLESVKKEAVDLTES